MLIHQQKPSPDRYTLIPRTLIFIKSQDHLLLLKGAPEKKLWANLYNGIGGHIEQGEDIYSAALRELHEETGLKAVKLNLCGMIVIDTGQSPGIGVFVFTGESADRIIQPSVEGSLEWIELDRVYTLSLVEDLPILLPRVLSWQPGQAIFSALYQTEPDGTLKITFSP